LEFEFLDGSRSNEVAFCVNGDDLIRLAGSIANLSGVENVYLADFDLLVDLLFFELGVLR
jgi:hypothetical protein